MILAAVAAILVGFGVPITLIAIFVPEKYADYATWGCMALALIGMFAAIMKFGRFKRI